MPNQDINLDQCPATGGLWGPGMTRTSSYSHEQVQKGKQGGVCVRVCVWGVKRQQGLQRGANLGQRGKPQSMGCRVYSQFGHDPGPTILWAVLVVGGRIIASSVSGTHTCSVEKVSWYTLRALNTGRR